MSSPRVAIVGGGVSGLATAYYLGRLGVASILIEKSPQLGGLIRTKSVEGCRLESGPDSFISTKPAVAELARELGSLAGEIIPSNDALRRVCIVRGGKLVPFPAGMTMMVPGEFLPAMRSELFSLPTKLGFLRESFMQPRDRPADVSIGELVVDHFGQEVLEYVAEPLLAGVYGGDAAQLSAVSVLPRFVAYEKNYGSLVRGVRRERAAQQTGALFQSFRSGMQSLTDTLTQAIEPLTRVIQGEAASAVRRDRLWHVKILGEAINEITAEHLVLATPAHSSARLLEKTLPRLAAELADIPYSSAILANFVYDEIDVQYPFHGFGFLVPRRERETIAAATWVHRKFPGRAAPGKIVLRAFIVGDEAIRLSAASDSELTGLVKRDFDRLMGIAATPRNVAIDRWPQSMPQYVVGHQARYRAICELLTEWPSLHLIGNAFEGVGIPDCVRVAKNAAARIADIKSR